MADVRKAKQILDNLNILELEERVEKAAEELVEAGDILDQAFAEMREEGDVESLEIDPSIIDLYERFENAEKAIHPPYDSQRVRKEVKATLCDLVEKGATSDGYHLKVTIVNQKERVQSAYSYPLLKIKRV